MTLGSPMWPGAMRWPTRTDSARSMSTPGPVFGTDSPPLEFTPIRLLSTVEHPGPSEDGQAGPLVARDHVPRVRPRADVRSDRTGDVHASSAVRDRERSPGVEADDVALHDGAGRIAARTVRAHEHPDARVARDHVPPLPRPADHGVRGVTVHEHSVAAVRERLRTRGLRADPVALDRRPRPTEHGDAMVDVARDEVPVPVAVPDR